MEGIRLTLEGAGGDFDEEVSGRTMLILTGPGTIPATKPPAMESETKPAPAETQR